MLRSKGCMNKAKADNLKSEISYSRSKLKISQSKKSLYHYQRNNQKKSKVVRENILHSFFNKRKRELITITNENKKMYQRINSQKSNYCSIQINKSYQSQKKQLRLLSESKQSIQKQNIHHQGAVFERNSQSRIGRQNKIAYWKKSNKRYQMSAKNIREINFEQMKNLKSMFSIQLATPQKFTNQNRSQEKPQKPKNVENKMKSIQQKVIAWKSSCKKFKPEQLR